MSAALTSTLTCWNCNKGERPSLQRCGRCHLAQYCDAACQNAAWPIHRRVCVAPPESLPNTPPAAPVTGVRLLGGFNRPFNPLSTPVAPDHPVWGANVPVSPVSQVVGVPIKIWRDAPELQLEAPNEEERDNQSVTYLMIRPETGFAATRWLKNIGPVTVVRADQKPLSEVALEMIWMYCDKILDVFGEDRRMPLEMYTPEAFQEFCQNYKEDHIENGMNPDGFQAQELPL